MSSRIGIAYNQPEPSYYDLRGEQKAVDGVLEAVGAVEPALIELGWEVVKLPLTPPAERIRGALKRASVELVFNLFEGFCGFPETEALLPEAASELGIPYTGCPAETLRLALDKARTKAVLIQAGFATPRYQLVTPQTVAEIRLDYPCIVKPCGEDASHGLSEDSVVYEFSALRRQVEVISNFYGGAALVEEFVDGREFNATVLGNVGGTVLPISEIVYSLPADKPRVLTFAAKWEPDSLYFRGTKPVCPAQITAAERERIAGTAVAVFRLLCPRGYARVDMRLDREGKLNIIEVNPNPDISPGTGAARQAEAAGMSYAEFIARIISLATEQDQCQPRHA